jgi:hypothetical protein
MLYRSAQEWRDAKERRVLLFGMSGLGKTHTASMLRENGNWFHYSIDYRIGTRYMGEYIADSFKAEAMKNPYLRDLLLSDSIGITSKISFHNLAPLSKYLGKPGDEAKGGLHIDEYRRRQAQHHIAEERALLDTAQFIERAQGIYGYDNFVCDSGGSICEVVDPWDQNDPIMTALSASCLMVWIKGSEAHTDELVRRFDKAPKPMCYQSGFLSSQWDTYLSEQSLTPEAVDPDAFIRWTYARAMAHRQPRYEQMATWGVSVTAEDVSEVKTPSQFNDLIARALETRG